MCRQNFPRTCLGGINWDSVFMYSSLKLPGKGTFPSINIISSLCGHCWWKTFLLTINMVFVFIMASLLEESLSQKKIRNLLFLYIVKSEAMLDINLCSIKLHELCEFDQKIYLQNNVDVFVFKVKYAQLFSFSWYYTLGL